MLPSVSVVIPTFKRSNYLKEAIDSVLNQDYENCDIIIVDDNAKYLEHRNETQKLLSGYEEQNISIKAVYPDVNLGGALARNLGIQISDSDYIAFLDDDDYFYQGKISKCIEQLESKNYDFVYNYVVDSEGKVYEKNYSNPLVSLFEDGALFATSQLVARRQALLSIGGFDDTPAKQDTILAFKLLTSDYCMGVVPEILNYYRHHESIRISTSSKTLTGEENLLKKYELIQNDFTKYEKRRIEVSMLTRLVKRSIQIKKLGKVFTYFFIGLLKHHIYFIIFIYRDFKKYLEKKEG